MDLNKYICILKCICEVTFIKDVITSLDMTVASLHVPLFSLHTKHCLVLMTLMMI